VRLVRNPVKRQRTAREVLPNDALTTGVTVGPMAHPATRAVSHARDTGTIGWLSSTAAGRTTAQPAWTESRSPRFQHLSNGRSCSTVGRLFNIQGLWLGSQPQRDADEKNLGTQTIGKKLPQDAINPAHRSLLMVNSPSHGIFSSHAVEPQES